MDIDHLPGTGGVVRFPVERRAKPTLMLAEELAPRSDLADAMADEWANGEDRPDTLARTVEAFTALAARFLGPVVTGVHAPSRSSH